MTTVATSYWPADTSEPVLETTVGGILRAAAAAAPETLAMVAGVSDPGFLELLETERGTVFVGVPTMMIAMLGQPDFERRDLSSLRAAG
jgi:acyl-CoA synthetase (AMP-forming)/AMP-acid ligase II